MVSTPSDGGLAMARIRSVKPEFWTSAQVLECSPNARLLFIGLWNFCDDYGRHPYSPKQCKAEIFPADPFTANQIEAMLLELEKNNLIEVYGHEDTEYFYVTGWHHQRIDKPQKPKYPDPFDEHSDMLPRSIPPDRIGEDKIREERKRVGDSQQSKKEVSKKERGKIIPFLGDTP